MSSKSGETNQYNVLHLGEKRIQSNKKGLRLALIALAFSSELLGYTGWQFVDTLTQLNTEPYLGISQNESLASLPDTYINNNSTIRLMQQNAINKLKTVSQKDKDTLHALRSESLLRGLRFIPGAILTLISALYVLANLNIPKTTATQVGFHRARQNKKKT